MTCRICYRWGFGEFVPNLNRRPLESTVGGTGLRSLAKSGDALQYPALMDDFPPRHVLCAGAVVTKCGRFLLVREARGRHAGRWGIPWGFVEQGELPDVAAERECLEEAGIRVKAGGLLGVQALPGANGGLAFVFAAHPTSDDEPRPDGDETDAAAYLSPAEMTQLPVDRWCQWMAERVLDGRVPISTSLDNPYSTSAWLAPTTVEPA
jgi:ADP-ribose pyrophosphatase YjhB (NUDIX family)